MNCAQCHHSQAAHDSTDGSCLEPECMCPKFRRHLKVRLREDSLDAAWAEAVEALPEGWVIQVCDYGPGATYEALWGTDRVQAHAMLGISSSHAGYPTVWGPTPAAALRALAAKLRDEHP